ncbi:MAG: SDR family oxidoreductase [Enhydrobacter sp.]|nr:MAG: SDR family oxidoreductase [Enhydrobacter sp.]
MSGALFVFGLGFSGLEVARQATAAGWSVAGSVTTTDKAARLREEGIDAVVLPFTGLGTFTHVLGTAPPRPAGDPVVAHVRSLKPSWLGYLSTTGVYGDRGGAWVDEEDEPAPGQPRSRNRLAAEREWQSLGVRLGVPVHVFRLPAIYGPGRSAFDQVREGRAQRIDKPGQVFSRIHVEDLARTVLASMARPAPIPGAVYNVCDDDPAPQADVIALACQLLGRPAPPLVPYDEAAGRMSDMARSFYAENRRVRNDRIKRELGVALRYPSYRDGLRSIHARMG